MIACFFILIYHLQIPDLAVQDGNLLLFPWKLLFYLIQLSSGFIFVYSFSFEFQL